MTDGRELDVSLEQLARMHRMLAALKAERERYSGAWFSVVTEGPLDEIERLEREIDRLTGRAALRAQRAEVSIRIVGAGLAWPCSPLSVLTNFADALRKGVQTISELVLTGELASRPTRALNEACDLRLVGLTAGSLVLSVELPTAEQGTLWTQDEAKAASRGLELLLSGASWAAGTEEIARLAAHIPDEALRRTVLTQVKRLVPRPRGKVTGVELSGALLQHRAIQLSRETTRRVDDAIDASASITVETHEGDLREIDLDRRTLVLRGIEGLAYEVSCEYVPELDQTALDALDKRVSVTGSRSQDAARRRSTLKVHRLTILERDDDVAGTRKDG